MENMTFYFPTNKYKTSVIVSLEIHPIRGFPDLIVDSRVT